MADTVFDALGGYFWLICLAISAYQYYAAGRRVEADEHLSESMTVERTRYIQRFIAASTLPWIVMGAGQLTGSTSSVWEYFRPQDMNVFVVAFFGSVFALSLIFFYWVFFMEGARKAVELKLMHSQGFSGSAPLTERQVKLFAGVGPLFVVAWIALGIFIDAAVRR
jgi:hypothetical protein